MGHITDRVLTKLRFSLNFAIFYSKCNRMHCLQVKIPPKNTLGDDTPKPPYTKEPQKTFRLQIGLCFLFFYACSRVR